ncbi:DoxX family protein [Flectobacillus major]|jgi:putative oxidoreductase|uniref:DoxX family protein n=1 Tax=Flectobacillus major TaxID=103 RepID=UPI00040865D4|nr:DoxX family protein [Flectobacillus major]
MKNVKISTRLNSLLFAESTNTQQAIVLLCFRVLLSLELIVVHGLKKLGIPNGVAEVIPNPYNMPLWINENIALAANLICPILVILGLFTRLATLPILAVTLSGYFIVHGHDSLLVRDIPFMYSLCFLFLTFTGAGKYSLDTIIAKNTINHD